MVLFKPGETCPKTAKYTEVDQYGNIYIKDGKVRDDVDVEEGEQFPPTREENLFYKEA